MSRPSIRTSLVATFSAIALITAGFAWVSLDSLSRLQGTTQQITSESLPSMLTAKDVKAKMLEMKIGYLAHITAASPKATTAAEEAIKKSQDEIKAVTTNYAALATSDKEREILKRTTDGIDAYIKAGEGMMNLSKMGMYDGAAKALGDMNTISDPALQAIDELVALNFEDVGKAVQLTKDTHASAVTFVYAIIAAIATLIAISTLYALRGIARPIGIITRSMINLAEGDTDKTIPYADRADEIGSMAGAVEIFRQAALSNKRLELEAEEARRQAEADRQRLTAEAETAAQRRLQQATSGLAGGLKRLAAGDLSFQLTEPFAPDFESLRHDLNTAVSQLQETLVSVAHAADLIDNGSREVSHSADDLARRTEQQAASLEETAAALDEITVNVTNSTRRTDEARGVAAKANASASQSGAVVASAVNAMGRIEQSSNQISNIIGVIDEIAFQTNLLALNAGVEAARAGEAGRGFAVVAQEVRELAQRSAKAAKEIKDLIRNSTAEVENGVKLVSETGEALKTIEDYVVVINQHMDAIATSAREQSTGLAEVNTAVNRMDHVTQQNAAMVEETNAAGATLANESVNLRALISHFTLQARAASHSRAA
ncbi:MULTISPECIES: methyl-accepting chemotaxis protein [unclassified Rhizobium]|uniref:methyl-accepting chemotaxis protein n=1 Tax=unclassified Rhizobium TaxID=2613769 RepID=UPI00071498CE|nr:MULTISPECIES: HAMP domain-containing methyl-accepting chemotaxis protein [unclassified Rhizobium]KQS83247.1 chemotaxis protein [Rhizobium sp. Leaf386]KQS88866.1 chemotaxis protein [Rhizobium sp. Leaf391]KQT92712.1 chemotaxis protein [Rhizobium sp. Leaf453]